jgi:hypothetical protein
MDIELPEPQKRLSIPWVISPVIAGLAMLVIAAAGHLAWSWDDFWTGTIVNFASSVTLVSIFFLLERRFESVARRNPLVYRAITLATSEDPRMSEMGFRLLTELVRDGTVSREDLLLIKSVTDSVLEPVLEKIRTDPDADSEGG